MKDLLIEQLRTKPVIEWACQKADISRMTLHRWRVEDAGFDKRVEAAVLDGCLHINDLAEDQLIAAIKDGNMNAIMGWLKTHHPAYKTKVEIEGRVIAELSPEQEKLMQRALQLANLNDHDS